MKLSAKLRKRIMLAFILPAFCLVAGGGLLYIFAIYRFKDNLKFIVNKESKGKYAFDANEAKISLWHRSIRLRGSVLSYNPDSANSPVLYHVQIPEMYFSITSWKDLLLHQKVMVDSLAIIEPDIRILVNKETARKERRDFRPSDILTYLEKTLTHLNVRSFSLKDASFTYKKGNGAVPLHGDHISLSVSNFTHVNNEDSHLLGSDNISISILGRQHWTLPDGRHEIGFTQLKFDSKGQRFELDSFSFNQKADTGKGEIQIYADKFFFNSRHLPAIYQKGQLLLDTLICINPVLAVPGYTRDKNTKDSSERIVFKSDLFNFINIKYISVIDGELQVQTKDSRNKNVATRKANMSIFNLAVNPSQVPQISTDSIRLNLKKIEFTTKDSLYKLTIDEFAILRNDALFRNVKFGPTASNHSDKGAIFTAPSLLLKDINIADLLRKRINASVAELNRPSIEMFDKSNGTGFNTGSALKPSPQKLALFYQTLHNVSELIETRDFYVVKGVAHYKSAGTAPLDVSVENLDAHILLHQFFISDSLVDIKHAIPDLHIDDMNLVSRGLHMQVQNYRFSGTRRLSVGERAELSTAGGMELTGKNIHWNILDWDAFQKTKGIQIDSLHIDDLAIHMKQGTDGSRSPPDPSKSANGPGKDLPLIHIANLHIDNMAFNSDSGTGQAHFSAKNLNADDIRSAGRFLTWNKVGVNLYNLGMAGKMGKATIGDMAFSSNRESVIKGLEVESGSGQDYSRLSVPVVKLNVRFSSTDPRQLSILSLVAGNSSFRYIKAIGKDSISVKGVVHVRAKNIRAGKDSSKILEYEDVELGLTDIDLNKGKLKMELPEAYLHLSDGSFTKNEVRKPVLSSAVYLAWKDARLDDLADSAALSATGVSGSFKDAAFRLNSPAKITWQALAMKTTISKGRFHYAGKKVAADAAAFSWDPDANILQLRNFSVLPNESRDVTFNKARWQGDYLTIYGAALTIAGVRLGLMPGDSLVRINKLTLDDIALTASRDKRLPFRHGIEKPMPTKLVDAIPFPLKVDSIQIRHSSITYNEFSLGTQKWSTIPIKGINGYILNVSSRNNQRDTLRLLATGQLFDAYIHHFSYGESYGDPLSFFSAKTWFSSFDLAPFSQVSVPAAAVSVTRGRADTAYANWEGNKYATYGTMNFFYDNLRVRVLNKTDINKGGIGPTVKTWAINLLLPGERKRPSAIFFERDREKFIFNYWVKAQSSGLISTFGIKKNTTYAKLFQKKYKQYSLPENSMDQWMH